MSNPVTQFKRLLFGQPLPSERLDHERLNKKTALAVLSSDAISSVAYATDQILFVLAVLGTAADRKSTRLNSSHIQKSRMPSSA